MFVRRVFFRPWACRRFLGGRCGRRRARRRGGRWAFPPAMEKCATISAAERLTWAQDPEKFMVTGSMAKAAKRVNKDGHRPHGVEGDHPLTLAATGRTIV